nr:integrase, catalytic region, zinc finger, CCHC-type, peptidase aspartic, catalytic [Tanacetum cinerariifolium]
MENDSKIDRGKKEIVKSIAMKAKKGSRDDKTSTSRSDNEEYAMAVRNVQNSLEERINLLCNQEKKRSHSDKEMRRKERVFGNVLDAVCLRTCLELDEWIKDSGCSKHMTSDKSLLSTYKAYDE